MCNNIFLNNNWKLHTHSPIKTGFVLREFVCVCLSGRVGEQTVSSFKHFSGGKAKKVWRWCFQFMTFLQVFTLFKLEFKLFRFFWTPTSFNWCYNQDYLPFIYCIKRKEFSKLLYHLVPQIRMCKVIKMRNKMKTFDKFTC